MQRELPRTASRVGAGAVALTFDNKLENEEEVLETILSALSRGQLHPDTWTQFHLAAVRDDRLAEVAFAYENATQSKRIKTLPPNVGAEFFFRASTFFSDAFGDELGAVSYLERALAASPTHEESFQKIEQLLTKSQSWRKLADVFAGNAPHHARAEHADLLRRAAELYEKDGSDDKIGEIYQQILRLEPHDDKTRDLLEARYLRANRHRDVTRLLEQALTTEPAPSDAYAIKARARLVEMYAVQLHEPERSMPHIEAILAHDPSHEEARRVAAKLIEVKGLAARAAAALAGAYEQTGVPSDVAKFLGIELEHTRGPKRRDVLRKIGVLRQDRLNDAAGAFEAFEAALALDPGDDEMRGRYAGLASRLSKDLDAARTLTRVGAAVREGPLRAKLTAEVGSLYLAGGDTKRAKATFLGVLAMQDLEPAVNLAASRALCAIFASEGDNVSLGDALERVALVEPDAMLRQIANEELAELATETLKDSRRAIGAWKRLLDTSARPRALEALEPLYEAAGDSVELAAILDERAKDATDPKEARRIAFRAAEVLTSTTSDVARASLAWRAIVEKYGPARDVHEEWIPLLEAQRQWPELASALDAEAGLAPPEERAAILVRLGGIRLQRTREIGEAIDAFRRALEVDATERTSRGSLEKLLGFGDHRLEAAAVLEPIYRAEGASAGLLKILDLKAQLAKEPDARLDALEEGLRVAEQGGNADRQRALDFIGRGLTEAVASERPLDPWLERLERAVPPGSDSKRRASMLSRALGARGIDSPALLDLAKRAGEALAASGDVAAALEVYRRALAFEPTSGELLTRVDDLLRDQGDPRERISLYQAALARNPSPPRRRELLHKIGSIQKSDVGDLPAAIETYRTALGDSPDDHEAHGTLAELYTATAQWVALCELLEQYLQRATGEDARRARLQLAEVAATHGDRSRAHAQLRALLGGGALGAEDLGAIARLADVIGDVEIQRETLQRRASSAEDPREQVAWLDKLAALELSSADAEAAVDLWKRAAQLAEKAGDDEQARRLYDRARDVSPHDGETALRLADLLERAEDWKALPELYGVLLEATELPRARVAILMRHARVLADHLDDPAGALVSAAQAFELAGESSDRQDVLTVFSQLALRGRGTPIFARAMDDAIAKLVGDDADLAAQRADLAMAKARVMAANREGRDAAASAYRSVLDDARVDETRLKAALLSFESLLGAADSRTDDRRWLFGWKVDHAPEGGLVPALLAWASAEETAFLDLPRAFELYRRAQALDPENTEVMASVSRLALATGDTSGAIAALTARRDRSEGAARSALELEIATILVERTDHPEEALASVAAVLQSSPQDEIALGLAGRLLALPAAHVQAIAILERTSDAVEDPDVRAQVLRYLLDTQADPPDSRELRRRWFERLLELRHAQGNVDLALHTALAAAAELPTVESLWDRAESLARELQRPNEVAELYQTALAQPLPRESALALGQRAATFHEEWFEDSAGVVRILERVLEIDPSASWAFDRLKLLFDAGERWDDLFALYDRALASAESDRRLALLEDAAQIAKDFANNSDRAIGYLEQLLVLKPGDRRLVAALERLYERHGSHRELITLLSAQIASLAPAEAQRARARVALLWLDEIGDSASALAVIEEILQHADRAGINVFELLEKVLSAAPPHAEARESIAPPSDLAQAGTAKRRDSIPPKSKRVPVRQRAAALLKELYTEAGREADLVRILEIELEAVTNVKERIRRHNQIAAIHTKLGNDVAATEHLASLVMLEPDVATHRTQLSELAAKIGRYDRLAEVLAAAADESNDDELRVELLMHAADVQASHLRDSGRAIDLLLRVLALAGVAKTAALAAARRAEPLLEAAGRSWERLDVLERIAELEPDVPARIAARTAAAVLATELGENVRAIAAWEARLEVDREHGAVALDGLVPLLEREKRWPRLIEVLDRRASTERSALERRADRVQIARIQSTELAAVPEAIAAWHAVEQEFGESDESMDALASLLKQADRWADLADLFERGAARAATPERRAELLHQLGDLQAERLTAFDRAITSYEAALAADPRNEGARAGLRALLDASAWRGAAIRVLLGAFSATDEWSLALELTEHRLAAAEDAPARVAVLREVARVSEERAKNQGHAFQAVRRAFLELAEDRELQSELARLAEATGEWQAYADAYRHVLEREETRADANVAWLAQMRLTVGEVLERRLDSAPRALEAYVKAAQEAPSDVPIARAVIRAAGATARWDAAATVVVAYARAAGGPSSDLLDAIEAAAQGPAAWDGVTRALASAVATAADLPSPIPRDIEARIGTWHRDRRGDPEAAEAAFSRALSHDSLNAELLASLAQIQRRAKGRPLIDSLLRLSQATGGDLDLLREAAEIAVDSVADRALAKSILDSLMRLARERWVGDSARTEPALGSPVAPGPLVRWTLEQLVRIHDDEGNPERTVELLVETARLPFERVVSRTMLHDAARISRTKLADNTRAIVLYSGLFDDNVEDAEAVRALVELYELEARHADLLILRTRQIANARSIEERLALRLQASKLEMTLGNTDGCIKALRDNLAESPRHAETCTTLFEVLGVHGRFADLAVALSHQAELAEAENEQAAAADLWERAAVVSEERQADAQAAVARFKRVVALEPRASSLDALARLSAAHGDQASAAQYLEKLHAQAVESQQAGLILRLADALTASGRADLARARLEEELAKSPNAEPVRARLAQAYREASAWEPLAELLSVGAEHAPDKATRLGRLLDAADLYTARSKRPELAIPLLERASDLDPENRTIRLALADALGAAGRFGDAQTLLRALIDSFGGRRPKERAPVHYYLARLELKMGDRARALVELDAATRIDPANPQILRALAELARDDGQLDRAERSYRALLVALKRPEEADDAAPMVRSEVLLELAAIAERQGEQERAGEILESALETASKSDVEARRMEKSLRDRGKYETLVRALSARLARAGGTPSAAPILSELAEVLDVQLGHLADAFVARLRALSLLPTSIETHDAALALARRTAGVSRYVDEVEKLVAGAEATGSGDLACTLLLRLGKVAEEELHDDARAADLYRRARVAQSISPGATERDLEVLRALDRVYERLGDREAQGRVLGERVEIESKMGQGHASGDALYRFAALRLELAETLDEGCDRLAAALDVVNDTERAVATLRTAAEAHPTSRRVLDLYEQVARTPGRERSLVDALTRQAALPAASTEPLREAIGVARDLGDGVLTETLLRRYIDRGRELDLVAETGWALAALAELREGAGDMAEAIALKRQAADVSDPEVARRLRFDIDHLAADALGDLELAAQTYEGVLEHEPADREAWLPLLEVYRRTHRTDKLVDLLARVVDFVDDNSERSRLRLERVRVMIDQRGLGDDAAAPLREIVDDDPSQVEAAILLAGILERTGRDDELSELLAKQIDSAKDRSESASVGSLSLRLAALLEKKSRPDARAALYAALEWEPKNLELLRALVRLHSEEGDTNDRADVIERLLGLEAGDEGEKIALQLHSLRTELGDMEGAERALELGYRSNPAGTIGARLEKLYRARGAWAKLAELFVVDAGAESDASRRVARLREAASIYKEQVAEPARAAELLRQARAAAPEDRQLLDDLVDMLVLARDPAGAVTELTSAIERPVSTRRQDDLAAVSGDAILAPLYARRASLQISVGEVELGAGDQERAFKLGGAPFVAELVAQLQRLRGAAAQRGDAAAERGFAMRLAEVLPIAGDVEGARALLSELVKQNAKDRDVLRLLGRIEEHAQNWDGVTATYRRLIALEEGDALVEIALRLADACERGGRFGDARGALERARLAAPHDEALRACLSDLYERSGAYKELAEMNLADAKVAKDVAGRFAHLLRAGALLVQHGADPRVAAVALEEAHALRPSDPECTVLLADAYTLAGRSGEAVELINQAIASHKGKRSREVGALYHRLARVSHHAGDQASEVAWLASALDMDGQNGFVASELATVAMGLGQMEVATRALRTITMLKPPVSSPISKGMAYQYLAELARQQGDIKRAVMLLKRAVDEDATLESARLMLESLQE